MDEKSLEQLADQAATGLRSDRELYLDVKQELHSHLEDKADHFVREGHNPEESVELAKKSFGSPLDVASELLAANKQKMKLRSILRVTFGTLIVPLAILLALYLGYGRFVRLQAVSGMMSGNFNSNLPSLPLTNKYPISIAQNPEMISLAEGGAKNTPDILRYVKTHPKNQDTRIYYAYYTLFLKVDETTAKEPDYVAAMRLGEQIDPQNALYNVLLAEYYLKHGIMTREEKASKSNNTKTDEILDQRAFNLGIAELHKAVNKPYLHTYQKEILQKKLNALPDPFLIEDYLQREIRAAAIISPQFAGYRELARKIPGSARILISKGHPKEAEALLDTWKPYTRLLLSDQNGTLINPRVISSSATILTRGASPLYEQLGEIPKAREAGSIYAQLMKMRKDRAPRAKQDRFQQIIQQRGSQLAVMYLSAFGKDSSITIQELTPGRMLEYVLAEEVFFQALLVILAIALVGTLIQGTLWLFRLRRASSVPLLLMLPVKEIVKALILGILLPVALYLVYASIPAISGRNFSLHAGVLNRMRAELAILAILVLWIPIRIIRLYIRQRCSDLDIPVPATQEETITGWKVRVTIFAALVLSGISIFVSGDISPVVRVLGVVASIAIAVVVVNYASRRRSEHGLYYGTLARSLAPIYALSIILISCTVQPWLMHSEAKLLRTDTVIFGYLANSNANTVGLTLAEARASVKYTKTLSDIINGSK